MHVVDRSVFRPVTTAVRILHASRELASDEFGWLPPPYEYEQEKMPIDILWGSDSLRTAVDSGKRIADLIDETTLDIVAFESQIEPHLFYD